MIELKEYTNQVLDHLKKIAKQDTLDDLQDEYFRPIMMAHIAAMHRQGYTVSDAALGVYYTSQELDEAYAIKQASAITAKYACNAP